MANPTKVIDGKTLLQCKECCKFKEVGSNEWYPHYQGYLGVLGRCKDCILEGRKREHELQMARVRDKKRFQENEKRRKYIMKKGAKMRKKYGLLHQKPTRVIKKHGLRPTVCPICYIEPLNKKIEAHHFDYSQPMKIIFACSICHSKLDRGIIDYTKCTIVDLETF